MWNQVCESCTYATFFHTPVWAELVVKAFKNLRIATKAYLFDDGTMAVLPLVEHRAGLKGFFKTYESMFPRVYGGIIAVVGCFYGFRADGGAEGVGRATTLAVVTILVLIIASDALFTAVFYFF